MRQQCSLEQAEQRRAAKKAGQGRTRRLHFAGERRLAPVPSSATQDRLTLPPLQTFPYVAQSSDGSSISAEQGTPLPVRPAARAAQRSMSSAGPPVNRPLRLPSAHIRALPVSIEYERRPVPPPRYCLVMYAYVRDKVNPKDNTTPSASS